MSKQEILEKAIQRAIDGGWKWHDTWSDKDFIIDCFKESPRAYIFEHNFAKALWGEDVYANFYAGRSGDTLDFKGLNWQGHLINMVLAEDPIEYLGKSVG